MIKVIICCVLLCVPVFSTVQANSSPYEEQDSPISFKIELVPWEIVNELLPRKSFFTIIDIETGLEFRVQRRAGSAHADVQPLTIEDTKIMKQIYSGKWSWKRRAIIVRYEDQMIAASMHGMPHGAGALQNGFPGHFCVHFLGSTTHGSKEPDFAHMLMLLKAGGKLDEFINKADPYQLINIFSAGINQGDKKILAQTMMERKKLKKLYKKLDEISIFTIKNMSYLPVDDSHGLLSIEIPVEVEIFKKEGGKETIQLTFVLLRNSIVDRWYIQQDLLHKELSKK
ncbi:hypothetical protein [Fredinandcohnia sp. 179-A 10B2 NHS]|uniref:hypothetical protein n=1 Tax=Fredinandcohnia sp. 179-A 10B2 NHS TaxID=3235176 RepID=UPI0039A25080